MATQKRFIAKNGLDNNAQTITNVADPVNAQDAATKAYVLPSSNPNYTGTLTGSTGVLNIGSGQVYKDASGNVGIGTSSPASKLDIGSGNLNFSGISQRITGDMSNATVTNRFAFQSSTTNGSTILTVLPNGTSVVSGIGIEGDSAQTNGSFLGIVLQASGEARFTSGIRGTGTYLPITFHTSGSEKLRIDTSGNVGIGTTSPTSKLNIVDASATVNVQLESGLVKGQYFASTSGGGVYLGSASAHPLVLRTDTIERMRIDSSGNVGIGNTPSGTYKLEVTGNIKATGSLIIGSSGVYEAGSIYSDANYGMIFRAKQSSPAAGYEFLWTKSDGTWLFGHNGTALTTNVTGSSGSCTGNAATAGTATNQSGGTVSATTGTFSGDVYTSAGQFRTNRANAAGVTTSGLVLQIDGGTQAQIVTPASGTMAFYTGNIERVRIDNFGNVTLQENISVGGAVPTTSGSGITFPTPNVVSTNANTLDDYEEGTWTPVLTSGFTTTGTVTNRSGVFTKIGRSVTVSWIVQASTVSPANGAVMSGLPFSTTHYGLGLAQTAGGTGVSMTTAVSGSNLVFGGTSIAPANLVGSVTYITAV
jgi:hypothetical protein